MFFLPLSKKIGIGFKFYSFFISFYLQVKSVDKSVQGTFVLKSGTDFRQFSVVTVDFSTLATKPVVSIFLTSKYCLNPMRIPDSLCMGFIFLMDANTSKYFYNYFMGLKQTLIIH